MDSSLRPSIRIRVSVVLLLLTIAGCDSAADVDAQFAKAKTAQAAGDSRTAVIELKNVLQEVPAHAEARWRLGNIYLSLGQGSAAVKELEQAERLGYDDAQLPVMLLRARLLLGEFKKVLGTLSTMDNVAANADLVILGAQSYLGLRRLDDAESAFREALGLKPENVLAQRGLAQVALTKRDFDTADKQLTSSIESDSEDIQTWLLKGELELSRGDFDAALTAFQSAEKLLPRSPAGRIGLARALLGLGRPEDADIHLADLHKNSPSHPLINYFRGVSARQRNDLQGAQEALREVMRVQPNHLQTLLLMGSIQYSTGDFQQAEDMLSRFVASVPTHVPGRKLLAAVQLRLAQPRDAIETLEPAVKSAPQDPQLLAMLGSAYLSNKQLERGTELLQKAATLDPNAAAIRMQLAISHLASGASEKAVTALQSAVDLDPSFTRADLLLVFTHLRNRAWDKAETAARALIQKQPDDPVPLNLLGAALAAKGNLDAAREQYELALKANPDYLPTMLNLAGLDARVGKLDAAISTYRSALQKNPTHEPATMDLARILGGSGKVNEALLLLESLRSKNPKAIQPRLALANAYLRQRKPADALKVAEEASRLAPQAPQVLLALGQALAANGDQRRALTVFEDLARQQSSSSDAHYQLGLAYARSGNNGDARDSLQKALQLKATHFGAKLALGNLAVRTGETETALKISNELSKGYPKSAAGFTLQGDALMASAKPVGADAAYQQAFAVAPGSALILKRYAALRRGNRAKAAQTLVDAWLKDNPDDAAVRLTRASTAHQQGQGDAAIAEYERVLQTNPNSVMALNNLAWMYFEREDERALPYAERAFGLAGKRPEIMDTYGWLLVRSGQPENGLRILEKAARAAPNMAEIQYHLAAALANAGDQTRARKMLESLLRPGQDFPARAEAQTLLESL